MLRGRRSALDSIDKQMLDLLNKQILIKMENIIKIEARIRTVEEKYGVSTTTPGQTGPTPGGPRNRKSLLQSKTIGLRPVTFLGNQALAKPKMTKA